ncbi:hypothetical protein NP493_772g02025 [Ridgeia piscesae]|uniref:CUB domain-containing protein n=1 Tax=Ridgeia piscesae TaxID=27915 RepID=A0AAD9NLX1_RIDPI|nr:hypothetical protein NP493_772g02025 [Ridgeia piscesae]
MTTCRDIAQRHTRGKTTTGPLIRLLSCFLFIFSVSNGEFVPHGVNRTACRHEPLVLACPTHSVVATKLYGGHHKDDNSTTCSYLPGDCQSSIRGLRITIGHWADCFWKMASCTIKLPDKHVFLHKPCLAKTIHYLIAEDFKCVPKNEVYPVTRPSENTKVKVKSMTGYVISPGYPQTYSADGRRLWVTIAARAGSGVLLQTVDMELRPEVAGLCTDYVEVNCSANSTSWRHCGTTPWSISPDRCRGDVNVTFVTTQHTKLYKGFVVFFRRYNESSSAFPVVSVVLAVLLSGAVFAIAWLVVRNRRLTASRDALRTHLQTQSPERGRQLIAPFERTRPVAANGTHHVPPGARLQHDEYGLIRPDEDVL